MAERKKFLDYAKGLGILLIMFAHSSQYFPAMEQVNEFVCSFHVPIFFVASGYLAYYKKNTFNFKKRARVLLVPYVVYSVFNSVLKIVVLALTHSLTKDKLQEEAVALLITGNGTVWFLLTLFVVEMLFYILRSCNNKRYLLSASVLIILPYFLSPFLQNPIGIVLIRIIAGLGFYVISFITCSYIERHFQSKRSAISVGLLVGGFLSYIKFGSRYSFFEGRFDMPWWSLCTGLLLSLGTVLFCNILEKHFEKTKIMKAIEFFGENSLIIMLIHPTILLVFTYPFAGFFGNIEGVQSTLTCICLFLIIVLLELPAIYIVNRWFSWTLGKRGN